MLSPDALLAQLQRLARNTANPPEPEDMPDLCADWMELLGEDLDDAGLREAVTRHLRTGRFWPTPSELLVDSQRVRGADPKRLEADGERLFVIACKARSSCGPSAGPAEARALHALRHYGAAVDELEPLMHAIGNWASFENGDPVHDARRYEMARRDFGKRYAAIKAGADKPTLRLIGDTAPGGVMAFVRGGGR